MRDILSDTAAPHNRYRGMGQTLGTYGTQYRAGQSCIQRSNDR